MAVEPRDEPRPQIRLRFADRLAALVSDRASQLVLGLDPDPARLWPGAVEAAGGDDAPPAVRAARAVERHCGLVLEAVAAECVAVKLQVACFERLGGPGWEALAAVAAHARRLGLLVVADAKRGDIDVSAAAYAQAFLGATETPFGPVPGLGADALTVNPLLGEEALLPFADAAAAHGAGLFVLVRTSNPGAGDIQDQPLAAGGTVSDRIAEIVARLGDRSDPAPDRGSRSPFADVGAVVGATAPGRLAALRERMPRAVLLLPGVGAQGGRVEELAAAWASGPAGGLITVSRGIVRAHERVGLAPATAAAAEARRLRTVAWELAA